MLTQCRVTDLVLFVTALCGITACDSGGRRKRPAISDDIRVAVVDRVTLRVIGSDTLSDSARVLAVYAEPDGDDIAFLFEDPAKGITSGLGLIDRAHNDIHLIWPDSVVQVAWPAAHRLAFRSLMGKGVLEVGNVHADTVRAIAILGDTLAIARSSVQLPADLTVRARATALLDSIRLQPAGKPQRSALRYPARSCP